MIYSAIVAARNALYDGGVLKSQRLKSPVVSVGNLRVGGAGKTPFTIAIGKLFQKHGIAFDVLSRGYGRSSSGVKLVDVNGSSHEFGDEPLLIAKKLEVPVIVGESRYAAGAFAEKQFAELKPSHGLWVHLLDDGFQHRQLARDFDIVLVTPTDAKDSMLPFGRLREPLKSLLRADVIVLTEGTALETPPNKLVWYAQRKLNVDPKLKDEKLVAFCGIAQPQNFFVQLREAGLSVQATKSLRDHHRYSQSDIQDLLALRKQHGATAFITTEKDLQNLALLAPRLQPLFAPEMTVEIDNPEQVIQSIISTVTQRLRHRAGN